MSLVVRELARIRGEIEALEDGAASESELALAMRDEAQQLADIDRQAFTAVNGSRFLGPFFGLAELYAPLSREDLLRELADLEQMRELSLLEFNDPGAAADHVAAITRVLAARGMDQ